MHSTNSGGDKDIEFLEPIVDTITIRGKLFYHEGSQAWSMLRLKKEIIEKFPHLKEKTDQNFVYWLKMPDTFKELKKEIEILEKKSGTVPFILLLGKEKEG